MDLSELTGTSPAASRPTVGGLVEAVIATTPAGGEDVDVLIGGQQRTGPCKWTPVIIDGALFTPARDDACFVAQARKGETVVVWWTPGDGRAGVALAGVPIGLEVLADAVIARMWRTGDLRHTLNAGTEEGWLVSSGQPITSAWPDLRALLVAASSPWGTSGGDPNLPDLGGRTLIGIGAGSGLTARALGDLVGTETHVLTVAQMPVHAHQQIMGFTGGALAAPPWDGVAHAAYGATNTGSAGGDGAHPNMQPSAGVVIKVKT